MKEEDKWEGWDLAEEDFANKYRGDKITIEEMQAALKQIKNRKAPGPDEMNAELLKYGRPLLAQYYCYIL